MLNTLIFIIFYFAIIFSVLGYGYLVLNFSKNKYAFNSIGYIGLIGILSLIVISYLSHFFVSHNYIFNSFLLIIGLFFFFKISKNKKFLVKKNFKLLILVFIILFIGIMMNKTHDDFPYYHFPYTYYLTQSDIHIGIGNFNHGFRTSSSIFYLNSLFYLPLVKYYLFQLGAILIMGFCNLILLEKIFFERSKKKDFNNLSYLSLLSFIFINIFFYRIQEHGTDRSAQILILILFIELLLLKNIKILVDETFSKIFVILALIISLKSFYVLYSLFLIPVGIYLFNKKNLNLQIFLYKNFFIYLFITSFFLITIISLLNSGCLIYPVSITCFENLSWSIPISEVNHMNDWYEQWSKAGAGPNFRVENPQIYIEKFNWVNHWFENYFFNKVSDFLLGILFIAIIFISVFFSKNKRKFSKDFFYFDYYIVLLILFIEWFYNHPSLRYGGYSLIVLIIFYPLSFYLQIFENSQKKIKKVFTVLLCITTLIFIGRNIDRLIYERMVYSYKPEINIFYKIDENYFRIEKEFNKLIKGYKDCFKIENRCEGKNIKVKMFLNKYMFLN